MKIEFTRNEIYKLSTKQNLIGGQNHVMLSTTPYCEADGNR